MVLALYILNETLEPLLSKNIRFLPSHESLISQFKKLYRDTTVTPPVIYHNDLIFVYIYRDSLFFVCSVGWDTDLLKVLNYLEQLYQLLKSYFEVTVLNMTIILDNLILVTELIDESMDFGVIQITDPSVIRDYIRIKVNLPGLGLNTPHGEIGERASKAHSNDNSDDNDNESDNSDSDSDSTGDDSDDKHRSRNRKGSNFSKELGNIKKMVLRPWKNESKKEESSGSTTSTTADSTRHHHRIESGFIRSGSRKEVEEEEDEYDTDVIDSNIAKTTTNAVSWRAKGIHYAKNEFFLDVIERVQYFMDFKNSVVKKNFIHGEIKCRCYLSGMPTLKVAINKILDKDDRQFLLNCKFHQCVSLDSVQSGKHIEFLPPDGNFVLCKYELKRHINDSPMIKLVDFEVKPKLKGYKLKLSLRIEPHFKRTNSTTRLNLKIPLGTIFQRYQIDLSKPIRSKCDAGKVFFNVTDDFLLWEVGSMKGGRGDNQLSMATEFALFNEQEFREKQEQLRNSMGPPPLREGLKLEEIYKRVHEDSQDENESAREERERNDGSIFDTSAHTIDLQGQARRSSDNQNEKTNSSKDKPENFDTIPRLSEPVLFDFEIPYCTQSGINVEYLKIEEKQLKYQSFPWIRYKTISDEEYGYMV